MRNILIVLLAFITLGGISQDVPKFGVKFSGFVKTDMFYDSRQTVNVREGHFLLYPQAELLNEAKEDLNAVPTFNMLSIQTRVKAMISGPDALGAKTSGVIEGEFFGTSNAELNGFRLRHALVKLDWTNTQLLVGQYWHPLFHTKCYPGTVSFNTGSPFQPFARNPQIRLTQNLGDFKLALSALAQRDFLSTGPAGASSVYIRSAIIPALNIRLDYHKKTDNHEVLVGASLNVKSLKPRTETDSTYRTDELITSASLALYGKYSCKKITVKAYAFSGQDATNLTMLGGYAVSGISDPIKDFVTYTPYQTTSFWLDAHTMGKVWQGGLFFGHTSNQGTIDDIKGDVYARGMNIDYVYRTSGRLIYNSGKFRVAPEIEYTVAAYAKTLEEGGFLTDEKGKIKDSQEVGNFRFLIGVYYFF